MAVQSVLPQVIPFGGDETSRKLLRAQLTRVIKPRTSATAGLKWNIIQVKTWLVIPLGDGCVCSGSGGLRG